MLESKSKQIGRYTYVVTQLNARDGRRALTRLARVVGPAMASGAEHEGESAAAAILGAALGHLSEDDVDWFCDLFAPQTRIRMDGGKEPKLSDIFEIHFAGQYLEMVKWLLFALEVNFGSFLPEVGALRAAVAPAKASEPSS